MSNNVQQGQLICKITKATGVHFQKSSFLLILNTELLSLFKSSEDRTAVAVDRSLSYHVVRVHKYQHVIADSDSDYKITPVGEM